ncbi:UNVERIFIED_CONTAM: hypothetical protein ABID98_004463 [Brevibacillus sp. OAP136]|nr:hypothetical protein [Brevibacillus fluminis]
MAGRKDEMLRRNEASEKEPYEAEKRDGYGDKKLEGPNRPAE